MVLTAPLSSQPLHAIRVLISTCNWNLTKDNQSFESSRHWQFIPPNLFPGVLKEISGRDFKNDSSTSFNFNLNCTLILVQTIHIRHWQLIRSKLGFYFSSGITLDIDVIFLWRTSYWSIEDKTYKKDERNPF